MRRPILFDGPPIRRILVAGLAVLLTAAACTSPSATVTPGIDLALVGVEPLGGGFHYEGWVVAGQRPVSTGRFNIDDDGLLVDLDGEPILEVFSPDIELADVEAFFLSIEPPNDPDTEPSPTHLLAGTFSDGVAELGVSAPDALGIEASESKGAFVLATPSDGPGTHERSGVWFVYPDGRPGLDLPKLPKGWTYEGWAFIDEVPVTTGTFRDGASADGSNRYSAELEPLPPLPGEDFLVEPPAGVTFPPELRGQRIIVSIEPDPDTGAGPFYLRPLTYDVPQDATDRLAYEMHNDAATFPTGAATLIP